MCSEFDETMSPGESLDSVGIETNIVGKGTVGSGETRLIDDTAACDGQLIRATTVF